MNIFLWVLQSLLAIHTAMGAGWKFSNTEQAVPSLSMIPHNMWIVLSLVELLCAVGLVFPAFNKRLAVLVPISAILIALEMMAFCGLRQNSGTGTTGEMTYWLVVAVICLFVAFGRWKLKPIK